MTSGYRGVEEAYRISALIYDAVLEPEKWPGVLDLINDQFRAQACAVSFVRASDNSIRGAYFSSRYEALGRRFLAVEHSPRTDPRLRRLGMFPNRPMHCRQVVSDDEWHSSELYQKLFAPDDFDYTLATFLLDEARDIGLLVSILRLRSEGPFDDDDLERMQLYVPHLRRASLLMAERLSNTVVNSALKETLDMVDLATFIVDARCTVEFANAAARELLERREEVSLLQRRLVIGQPSVHKKMARDIEDLALNTDSEFEPIHFSIPGETDETALYATVSALSRERNDIIEGGQLPFRAVVFLNDPSRPYETDSEHIQRLFGLTSAEADVTRRLAEGASPRDIAAETGRSYETVRWHLKQVMIKTGARRQSQLVGTVRNALAHSRPRSIAPG